MSIEISPQTQTRLTDEARRLGISLDMLLERLMNERCERALASGLPAELPIAYLGVMGPLRRRDIYDFNDDR